jgi:hypothetical protein
MRVNGPVADRPTVKATKSRPFRSMAGETVSAQSGLMSAQGGSGCFIPDRAVASAAGGAVGADVAGAVDETASPAAAPLVERARAKKAKNARCVIWAGSRFAQLAAPQRVAARPGLALAPR